MLKNTHVQSREGNIKLCTSLEISFAILVIIFFILPSQFTKFNSKHRLAEEPEDSFT